MASATYYDNRGVDYDNHESLTLPASTPRPLSSPHGVGEDPTAGLVFSHVVPRQWSDIPITRTYTFRSERSLAAGAQSEIPCGTAALSRSPGEGPSRHSAVGPPFSSSSPADLDPRHEQLRLHRVSLGSGISAQSDAGPSGSRVITSVSSCGA